jgi:hypothetical protein
VTGLAGMNLTLQNGNTVLVIPASGPFAFPAKVASGTPYNITVHTQPDSVTQTCTVTNGSGTVGNGNVTDVAVACTTNAYTVGGTISGLTGTLVLVNNGVDDLTIPAGSTNFTFATSMLSGATYAVGVKTHPGPNQVCSPSLNYGQVGGAPVTTIKVTCAPALNCNTLRYTIAGVPSGDYLIDPDGTGPLPPITAYCDMVTDGGGYTMYGVTGGISTTRFDQPNSCTAVGLKMAIPRTHAHLDAMYAKYGSGYFAVVPGVYGKAAGNYTTCAMNFFGATVACRANWVALDNNVWFARATAYTEPSGDYTPGCWLGAIAPNDVNGMIFNDAGCTYATGTSYVCSDNAR